MGLDRLSQAGVAAAAGVALALVAGGCFGGGGGGASPPARLFDGSPPGLVPDDTEIPKVAVVSRARLVRADRLGARFRSCAALTSIRWPARTPVVERAGVAGGSITVQSPSGEELFACDETGVVPDDPSARPPWCGVSAGQLFNRRLLDARLDILCRSRDGTRVAFAWVEAPIGVFWIGVDQGGYVELYRPVGHRPVRVAAGDARIDGSSATFELSFYGFDGRKIGEETLTTAVAG